MNLVPVTDFAGRSRRAAKRARSRGRQFLSRWSPAISVGPNIRLQARRGRQAAVMEVQPGVWIVADMDQQKLQQADKPGAPELGIVPALIAPALVAIVNRALRKKKNNTRQEVADDMLAEQAQTLLSQTHVQDAMSAITDRETELGCRGDCRCR